MSRGAAGAGGMGPALAAGEDAAGRFRERQVLILMGSRLALSLLSLGIALVLDTVGGNITVSKWHGFYGTVAFAFLATVVYRLALGRIRRPGLFAAINIATDIAIVSALVLFSGGGESVFTFLYVLVAVYAAVLFRREGALAWAALAVAAYGGVLLAGMYGVAGTEPSSEALSVLLMKWLVHACAVVLVAILSSFLAAELKRTGEVLEQRTSDLVNLRTLHQRTVESLMSGLLTTNRDGRVTSFNPEAERITGMREEQARGMDVEEVLAGVRECAISAAGDDRMSRTRLRLRFVNREQESRHLGVAAYILKDAEGQPSGHVVIFQDVTDVVRMEEELRRSERLAAIGELSASIAHEIRNPLAAISGSIQVLQGRVPDLDTEPRRLMAIVIREVDRLNHLITDFLDYARPGPIHLEPLSVQGAVDEVLEMFMATRPVGVSVHVDLEEGLAVQADAAQFRQVLWNLILNASQAMPEGGVLGIEGCSLAGEASQAEGAERRTEEQGKSLWAEIAVMDQGSGVPEDVLEHIFDPFFTTKKNGSGLGLPTVHRIVEEHGGSVRIETPRTEWSTVIRARFHCAEGMR